MARRLATLVVSFFAAVSASSSHAQVFSASGLPLEIPDAPTVTSTISVTGGPASVTQLELVLRIDHTALGNLDILLVRGSKYLHLSSDNGSVSDNFANVRLRDDAYRYIGVLPSGNNVTGDFRPEGGTINLSGASFSLAGLTRTVNFAEFIAGESADGDWTLVIDDDSNGNTGSLTYWSLEFNDASDPTGPTDLPLPPAFSGDFTSTPNLLVFGTPSVGTTVWNGPNGAQPGLTDGAGEDTGTQYSNGTGFTDYPGAEVAYRYVHTGGPIAFRAAGSSSDIGLAVIDSSGTPAGSLLVADGSFTDIEIAAFQNLPAGTYYVVVDTTSNFTNGTPYTLDVGIPPVNDACTNAAVIVNGASVAFDTSFSTSEGFNADNCFGTAASPEIYFVYTPTASGVATFEACDATFAAALSVQEFCTSNPIRCSTAGCSASPNLPSLKVCTTPGVPVYIRVAGFFDEVGSGTLTLNFTPGTGDYLAPAGTPEGETCLDATSPVDTVNGGCDTTFAAPLYSSITPGQPILGTSSNSLGDSVTDFDNYTFTLTSSTEVTITGQTEFDAYIGIVSDPLDCGAAALIAPSVTTTSPCQPGFSITRTLAPGTYAIRIAHGEVDNFCADPGNDYWVRLDAGAPCAADFNGVGGLDVQDIFDFLNAWFVGTPAADFNGIDGINVQDIFDFLNAWFAGC